MASKKNKNQLSLNLTFKDRRIPKLIGLVLLFLAAYLFVAFTSYLFTWRDDYDDVNSLGFFELLSSDTFEPSNLLGKLGAIVSNTIFWWGIGLSSFIFIYLLVIYGSALIKERPLGKLFPSLRNSLLLALFISVFLEFVFGDAEFPWGGAIGEVVSEWMTGFVGVAGMTILYLFLIVGIVIWRINPDFNNWTPQGAWEDLKLRFQEFLSQPFGSSKKKTAYFFQAAYFRKNMYFHCLFFN